MDLSVTRVRQIEDFDGESSGRRQQQANERRAQAHTPVQFRVQPEVNGASALISVELGGIEPPSISRWTNPLRPFPSLRLTQPRRRVG